MLLDMSQRGNNKKQKTVHSTVRIIGGQWRGRKLQFPQIVGLRPTPDRIRETLFNWLQAQLPNATCLDAFCGSGVLGLESLSRGAKAVTFIDQAHQVHDCLQQNLTTLQANVDSFNAKCVHADFIQWLASQTKDKQYSIAFIDPPYDSGLLEISLSRLAQSAILAKHALVYVEHPKKSPIKLPNENWQILKELNAGNNSYKLFITD